MLLICFFELLYHENLFLCNLCLIIIFKKSHNHGQAPLRYIIEIWQYALKTQKDSQYNKINLYTLLNDRTAKIYCHAMLIK